MFFSKISLSLAMARSSWLISSRVYIFLSVCKPYSNFTITQRISMLLFKIWWYGPMITNTLAATSRTNLLCVTLTLIVAVVACQLTFKTQDWKWQFVVQTCRILPPVGTVCFFSVYWVVPIFFFWTYLNKKTTI